MPAEDTQLQFQQLHIDVARNATDDFNPFHDKHRWQNIVDNPFPGPIVLGFQLEALIEEHIRHYRMARGEVPLVEGEKLRYSNYEFKFVNAVRAGQPLEISIKDSRFKEGHNPTLANRVSLKAGGRLAVAGYKRESRSPQPVPEIDPGTLGDLNLAADRSFLGGTGVFLKRKFMTTSNAKNFLSSSLVEQSNYIDELDDKVQFPEIFPCALISCALLERARLQGHDFERDPMVYKSHNISIDRNCLGDLRSNDRLHLLSLHTDPAEATPIYECFGIVGTERLLFSGRIELMPLVASQR